jgi:hypothetical protein
MDKLITAKQALMRQTLKNLRMAKPPKSRIVRTIRATLMRAIKTSRRMK